MSWGASSTTASNQNQSQAGNQASMPVEQPWVTALRSSFASPIQSMIQQAGMPVFGSATRANFMNDLNANTKASSDSLASNLASHGALDSGAYASGLANIQTGRLGDLTKFNANLPFQERQAEQGNLQKALATGFGLTGSAPIGQVSSSSFNGSSSGNQTTQSNPGLAGLFSSLVGMGLGMIPGFGSSLGGSPSLGYGQAPDAPSFNDIYGAMPGSFNSTPTPWASTTSR